MITCKLCPEPAAVRDDGRTLGDGHEPPCSRKNCKGHDFYCLACFSELPDETPDAPFIPRWEHR